MVDRNPEKILIEKLNIIIKLLATQAVVNLKPNEAIKLLGRAGLDRGLIAKICGTTTNTVSVTLSRAKKHKSKTRREKK